MSHRLTIEQMAAFKYILASRDDIFVDMGVWLPFGETNLPRQKCHAMMFNSVGKLVMTEFFGPGNYYLWSEPLPAVQDCCNLL